LRPAPGFVILPKMSLITNFIAHDDFYGIFPKDHPLFFGVCSGLDAVIVDFFAKSDLLVGVGFDPVESDKIWPSDDEARVDRARLDRGGRLHPPLELIGDTAAALTALADASYGPYDWTRDDERSFREELERTLRGNDPTHLTHPTERGLSALDVTRRLRDLFPPEMIVTTDLGSIKLIVSQAWRSTQPLTFFESNGLSAMGYSLPAAMAAKLALPDRPVLCTMGDGGFRWCWPHPVRDRRV
jgi:acetolactate synthase I/II/III large subunit